MRKATKGTPRPIRSQTPVIAVRTPQALYEKVRALAEESGATMSETIAALLEKGFKAVDYEDAFGSIADLMRQAKANARNTEKAALMARGWKPEHGRPGHWVEPGVEYVFPGDPGYQEIEKDKGAA
jgi:hypothetical protein